MSACAFIADMEKPDTTKPNVIRPTDDEARALARDLLHNAKYAAIGVIDPASGLPMVTRIALATAPDGGPITLISDLSQHTRALRETPGCSLLIGAPGEKGDPLTHPRLTLQCAASFVEQTSAEHGALRGHYLEQRPKAQLYIDFADFRFVTFDIQDAFLNGGFGKAYHLAKTDIMDPKT